MNKKTFYIHIGTWKTGSSTIQYNLNRLKKDLEKEGIVYLSKENKMVINDHIIGYFKKLDHDYIEKSKEKLTAIIERFKNKPDINSFVASAEQFSGDPFIGFKNSDIVARSIYEIVKDLNFDVKIIIYLRRQDDFFESLYTQSIYLGGSDSFNEFMQKFDHTHFNWSDLIESYSELFGTENIIVRRYHKKFLPEDDSLVQDFGKIINSKSLYNFKGSISRNKGFTRDALEIMRITNKHFDKEQRFQLRKLFQNSNTKEPFENYSYFMTDMKASFLSNYEKSNREVVKKYLKIPENNLFPEIDSTLSHKVYDGLNTESLAINFCKIILYLKSENESLIENKVSKIAKNNSVFYRIINFLKRKI